MGPVEASTFNLSCCGAEVMLPCAGVVVSPCSLGTSHG